MPNAAWRTRCRRATIMAVAPAVVAVAGCDGPAPSAAPGTSLATNTSQQPQASGSTGANSERAAVEAAYRRFWVVSWRLDTNPEAQWRSVLSAVAADPELTRVLEGTRAQKRRGITRYGAVVPRPTVVAINDATAQVRDCQGADKSGQADARTGRRMTVGVARNPLIGALTRGADGRWRITDIRYPGGRC